MASTVRTLRRGFVGACGMSLLLALPAFGQDAGAPGAPVANGLRIERSSTTGLASFVTAADGGPIPLRLPREIGETNVDLFLREQGALFGIADASSQLAAAKVEMDPLGRAHTTFQQVHQGIKVFAGVVKVHQDPAGAVHAANGDFFPIPAKVSIEPLLGDTQAAAMARARLGLGDVGVERAELVIVDPGWYGDPPRGAALAWHIVLADPPSFVREAFFIDARTGETLDQWTMLHTARDREVYDAMGTSALPGTLVRSEGDPTFGDADVDTAYDYCGDTYDYFFRAFGRDSIDDAGMTIRATVHSTAVSCPNAFWNGTRVVFCNGTVTDDVIGHELTHAVTEFTADLVYQNQSGQLNESYSDVFGELIDLFNGNAAFAGTPGGILWPAHDSGPGGDIPNDPRTNTCTNSPGFIDGRRWLIGEDSSAFGGAIRDMWQPPCGNDPDTANSPLQTCSAGDSGGVHSGSGVPNHAFAMLTDGKSFNGHVVTGIGPIKSGAVWYRALTVASDFNDTYLALNQAALDLIGTFPNDPRTGLASADMFTAFDAAQVDEALLAVEMNTDGACGASGNVLEPAAPSICDGSTVAFLEDFESGPNGWTVSNTAPPTPYDWELDDANLPFGRAGTVWRVDDPNLGNCGSQDESAVHSLTSPTFILPPGPGVFAVEFDHYLATEGAWDGGNVRLSVNGGAFNLVPRTAFEHNAYNGALRRVGSQNTNPLQGQAAWTGAGGNWGRSVFSLAGLAVGGDSISVQFDLGKDGCTGADGWYVDDFTIRRCPDDNGDGVPDHVDLEYSAASQPVFGVGTGLAPVVNFPLRRRASSDVTLRVHAYADLGTTAEFLTILLSGAQQGQLFTASGVDCPFTPAIEELVIPAASFNTLVTSRTASFAITASGEVGATVCGSDNYVALTLSYVPAGLADIDGDGDVDVSDLLALLADWGPCPTCFEDIDGDGDVDVSDLLILLANWG